MSQPIYIIGYPYAGQSYGLGLIAQSREEAEARLRAIQEHGQITGEMTVSTIARQRTGLWPVTLHHAHEAIVSYFAPLRSLRRLLPLLLLTLGCHADPLETQPTNNPGIQLELLFTERGCSMYRFVDAGHFRYWADCRGSVQSSWSESCGKGCTRTVTESVQTTKETDR